MGLACPRRAHPHIITQSPRFRNPTPARAYRRRRGLMTKSISFLEDLLPCGGWILRPRWYGGWGRTIGPLVVLCRNLRPDWAICEGAD